MSGANILLGKIALVTGAASGIGRAACQVLAREGASVIASDRNQNGAAETVESLSTSSNNKHISVGIDVASSSSVKSVLQAALEQYKSAPSIVINSAGITRDNFILKLSEPDFEDVININLKGTFLVVQEFANAMVQNGVTNGSIVNLGSIVGKHGNLGQANYCASKAGVELLTKTAAKELGKFGIRCNSVLPGFIKSPMTDAVPDKVIAKFLGSIPLGRMGNPSEVAELIAFLASDRSSYISGASIEVAGGF